MKTTALLCVPIVVFVAFFLLRSPHGSSPQTAVQHLISSLKRKDIAGISEVCTRQGLQGLTYTNGPEFTNTAFHDDLKSKGFRYQVGKHSSWDIWQEWARQVNFKNAEWSKNIYHLGDAADLHFYAEEQTISFTFVKTTWSGWKLNRVTHLAIR